MLKNRDLWRILATQLAVFALVLSFLGGLILLQNLKSDFGAAQYADRALER